MKLSSSELPLGKPQITRRKTPKIAPLLILFTVLFTIIPLYYPSFRYNFHIPKNLSETETTSISSSSSSFDDNHSLDQKSTTANTDAVSSISDHRKDEEEYANGVEEKVAESNDHKEEEEETVIQPEMDPARRSSSAKSGLAIAEALDKNSGQQQTSAAANPVETVDDSIKSQEQQQHEQKKRVGSRKRSPGRRERRRATRRREKSSQKDDLSTSSKKDIVDNSRLIDKEEGECDLFSGQWVPNPDGPYYTNTTCWAIQEHQNCMKFGRPETGFLKWRWKPDGCELPIFDPNQFLEMVRGKSIAFVGDSVARNHMQSLICLLSKVVYPIDTSNALDQNKRWVYKDYNFNISMFWAPYLVRTQKTDPNDVTKPFNLYLDEFDEDWSNNVGTYDYIIISAGHWFFRPTMFYVNGRLVGCQYCPQENVTHLNSYFSYRRAFRTALRAINNIDDFKGVTFLRTFAPSHFEGGPWDKGGDCVRTKPFKRGEKVLDDYNLEMYTIQLQELRIAQKEGRRKGYRFKLFDATQSMLLRPDGHPSKYGHWQNQTVSMANDCVHWCLPGPIDSWNDFLLELLKREEADRSFA
ncbi:OLC1v1009923C1 [Oldenlandia corymbosa var. corymbosa]|uniref:OLC1v1009923C1 n=1 Tax=Oldenlandia corymbosa var. corymbosa TaxID=529605 RepID=A0AAV1DQA2_OLDCO|nr:OLC1v1009923C1 [Oldenlandia corymbosa var. corymbosa]